MGRPPAVAGYFYPARPEELTRELERSVEAISPRRSAVGCVAPHAGLMYSGQVAGAVYSRLELPLTVVVLGPNHSGRGSPLAISAEGSWETPLGEVAIDAELAATLQAACPALEEDAAAHQHEHSLEMQVLFLRYLEPRIRIVPIILSAGSFALLQQLGESLAEVLQPLHPRPLVVASSDLNHYESDSVTRRKDRKAIDAILALDARKLYDTVRREHVTMCGIEAAVVLLAAAQGLGVQEAEEVRYATSADAGGDRARVVGYAGIVLW